MAGERSLQDLIMESKKLKKDKAEEDKKHTEPELQASKEMIDGFLKRNYDKENERREQKKLKQLNEKRKLEEKIKAEAKPTLSKGSIAIIEKSF